MKNIIDMLDLFYANKHLYDKIRQKEDTEMVGIFEDVIKQRERGCFDLTENGKCTACGNCCSNILPMSEREIKEIKLYIKKHKIKEQKHIIAPMVNAIDMTCPFLDDSKKLKCTIYEARPHICRCFICSKHNGAGREDIPNEKLYVVNVRDTFFKK